MTTENLLIIILGAVWLISIIITVADKICANLGKRRVPEKTLFIWALFFGAIPMYVTMVIIRHKTKKKRFKIGIPLIILLQLLLLILLGKFISF